MKRIVPVIFLVVLATSACITPSELTASYVKSARENGSGTFAAQLSDQIPHSTTINLTLSGIAINAKVCVYAKLTNGVSAISSFWVYYQETCIEGVNAPPGAFTATFDNIFSGYDPSSGPPIGQLTASVGPAVGTPGGSTIPAVIVVNHVSIDDLAVTEVCRQSDFVGYLCPN